MSKGGFQGIIRNFVRAVDFSPFNVSFRHVSWDILVNIEAHEMLGDGFIFKQYLFF